MEKLEIAFELIERFHDFGFEAYLVGGSVRDLIMNRLIKDIDITTNALPFHIKKIANNLGLKYIETGIKHGTVTIIYNSVPIEVTTFRTDSDCDGRHCNVNFVKTLKEDLSRRDFTMNSIAIDKESNYIDYFNGKQDIEDKIIRTVGNPFDRYREDKLRALRAIRFATVLNFGYKYSTYEALRSVNLENISKERIRDELIKILMSSNRIKGIKELSETGLLNQILPEIVSLSGINQSELHHPEKDVYIHTMLALESINQDKNSSLELILSILLHDIGKPITRNYVSANEIHFYEHEKIGAELSEKILQRLKFPKVTIDKVKWLIANHMRIHHFNDMKKSKKVSLIEHEYFTDLLKLAIADIEGSSGINNKKCEDFNIIYEIDKFIKEYKIEKENRPILTQKLINGFDIINLGVSYKEGIKIGQILEKVNDAIIENIINTKEEALHYAKGLI